MIIDFHTHFYPEKVAQRAIANVASIPGVEAMTDGTRAGLLASMERAGIDRSVGLPLVNTPANARGVNRWAELNSRAPIFLTGSVHPADPQVLEELVLVRDAGLKAVKVHPEYQNFRFSDRSLDPLWAACAECGLVVVTHAGADVGFPSPWRSNPVELLEWHRRFPRLTKVLAHFGSWSMWDAVEELLLGEELYFDTAFVDGLIEPKRLRDMIRRHGVEKVLFGTDSPWRDQRAAVEYMDTLGLSPAEWELVMGGNAVRLLDLN